MSRPNESFQDSLVRLFPDENHQQLRPGGNFVRTVTFQVTEACNMRCTYCYQHDKTPRVMTAEMGRRFIDLLLAADERSTRYVDSVHCPGCILEFIGGEPLLEIRLIDELTDYFLERCIALNHPWATRYRISICSNGLLYFDETVQRYLRKHMGQVSLSITIDGNKELHDTCRLDWEGRPTYDRAIAAADHWRKLGGGAQMSSKVTLSPDNLPMAGRALIDLIAHGYTVIHCNCVYEQGWTEEHATLLYQELKKIADYLLENKLQDKIHVSILDQPVGRPWPDQERTWCGGSGLMICLAPDGNIYPCLRYAPSSVGHDRPPLTIGNVTDGFLASETERQTMECMRCVSRRSQCRGTECENCPIAMGCGDCAAYSWEVTGKIGSRTTYHCGMHKARVLAVTYYRNKKHRIAGRAERFALNVPEAWALPIVGAEEYAMLQELAEVK